MSDREITNDDLNSAVRGLGMWSKTREELTALIDAHDGPLFASRVIRKAAMQVRAVNARSRLGRAVA